MINVKQTHKVPIYVSECQMLNFHINPLEKEKETRKVILFLQSCKKRGHFYRAWTS